MALSVVMVLALASIAQAMTPTCASTGNSTTALCSQWVFNDEKTSTVFACLVDVQDAAPVELSSKWYMQVSATGIPGYVHTMTSNDINNLNSRPHASSDFVSGATTAAVGDSVYFGEDIGYTTHSCSTGYWPPGPQCPSDMSRVSNFPLYPVESNSTCYTTLGTVGMWINGVGVYNWWDGTSYNMEDEWHVLANDGEYYDLDICSGHAAQGDYHHHGFPNCLAERLHDNGAGASPIYGFAADGVPILGPYVAANLQAQSCWKKRDYDDASSPTGCGVAGKRTCLLVDNEDISKGTVQATSPGPDTDSTVTTQSGNTFIAASGYFFEDYYYDPECSEQGDEYLDSFNGRYAESIGSYAYHVTVGFNSDGTYHNIFPHFMGPSFYGEVDSNTMVSCATSMFDMGAPPGNGGGGSQPPQGPAPPSGPAPPGGPPQQGPPPPGAPKPPHSMTRT